MSKPVFDGQSATRGIQQPWASPDGASLVLLTGDDKGASVPIPGTDGQSITVGKAKENDLVVTDSTVSRRHMSVTRSGQSIIVADLGSTNGIRVGGAKVKEAQVEPGTIISVGDAEVMVRIEARGPILPPSAADHFQQAVGRSVSMRRIFSTLERMAPTDATILLMGETGTGKDVLANSVHAASARANGPFEVVDCGSIAANLIESELFGHEKGAFTGADRMHTGAFERARGGTLFLDELGELPIGLQPKLLRVLEAKEIRRVGGTKSIKTDVRIVAATTRDLAQEVEAGRFRQDLFFRLAVVPVMVPPLRARLDDIPILAEKLLASMGGGNMTLSPEAAGALRSHEWPGNVRELRNVLERALYHARAAGETQLQYIDIAMPKPAPDDDVFAFEGGMSYRDARTRVELAFEERFVRWLLERSGGNIRAAARDARMDRKYLADLIRKHNLQAR